MQKLNSGNIITEVAYEGEFFTVCRAFVIFDNGKPSICAEGASRRSYLDGPNSERGKSIAEGRALKALNMKLKGRKSHVRHLLMAA